jgi:hypothetical protein
VKRVWSGLADLVRLVECEWHRVQAGGSSCQAKIAKTDRRKDTHIQTRTSYNIEYEYDIKYNIEYIYIYNKYI